MELKTLIPMLIGLLVLATLFLVLTDEKEGIKRGPRRARSNVKTDAVTALMKRFALRNDCKVLGPVTLHRGEQTVRLDSVAVGWFGVLGVMALGYNGKIYGNPQDKEWLWTSADRREAFANPINECALAARVMREALMNAGVRSPETEAVFVFTDGKAELCIPRSVAPMHLKDFRAYLRKDKFRADKGYDVEKMAAALQPFVEG